MTDPEALFKFLFKLPIWIVLFLVIGAIIKVLFESNSRVRKSNNIFRKIDIKDCHFQTLMNILDSDQDYHEIVRISKDTLFYIDEYQAFLIMYKNWTGNLKGKASDEKWLIKSSQDYKVQNVLPRLKNIEEFVKEQLNIELQAILVFNNLLSMELYDAPSKIVRIDNVGEMIKRKPINKKYTVEEIVVLKNSLCKILSKVLH